MLKKHNLNYKLVETEFTENGKTVSLVYAISNEGKDEGLEAYYHKLGETHHYRSNRWKTEKIPLKYVDWFERLKKHANIVPNGHKLTLEGKK